MRLRLPLRRFGLGSGLALVALVGFLAGSASSRQPRVAGAHEGAAPAGVKAPVAEVIHCPLAFAGVHLEKANPANAQVAYHYCKPVSDDVSQCLLYDGTGPDAKLIGVEYLVSAAIYETMPAEEKANWHDHVYEVDSGLLRSLTQAGAEEKATLAKVRTLYGKITHTWSQGRVYPEGPPRLFWAVTGEAPFLKPPADRLPPEAARAEPPAHR